MAALMCIASALVYAVRPGNIAVDTTVHPRYEQIVPDAFGDWSVEKGLVGGIVNPQQAELLDQLYSETVNRVYLNRRTGARIMLSLAYGQEQSKQNQVHRPEVCYPAQGFQITAREKIRLQVADGELVALRLVAKAGARTEPVTYWIRIGDTVTAGYFDQKLEAIKLRLEGRGADGLLFRVSSIDPDTAAAFDTQARFVSAFISAVPTAQRALFVGGPGRVSLAGGGP